MTRARHASYVGEWRGSYRCWWVNLKVRDNLGDLGIDA